MQLVSRNQEAVKHPTVHRVVPPTKTCKTEHVLGLRMRTVRIKSSAFHFFCDTRRKVEQKGSGVDQGKGKVKSKDVWMWRSTGQRWEMKAHREQLLPRAGCEKPR